MEDIDALVAARRAQKARVPVDDLDRVVQERRAKKARLKSYTPDLEEQAERMEGPATVPLAAKLAATTTPLVREVSMGVGEGLSQVGVPGVGLNEQAEFLADAAPSVPAAGAELAARGGMAKRDLAGYATGLARGVEAGMEGAFMAVPAAKGVGTLRHLKALRASGAAPELLAAASRAPEMLFPSGAAAAAGLVPGFNENVAEALPAAGGAVARGVFGAEEGGVGEAVGRTVAALAPAALPASFARGAGRSAVRGAVEPAARVGAASLRDLPATVGREGVMNVIRKSPSLQYQGANIAAMLGAGPVAGEMTNLAGAAGASPEASHLAGAVGGLVIPLAASVPEARLARAGARGERKVMVDAEREAAQRSRGTRLADAARTEEFEATLREPAAEDLSDPMLRSLEALPEAQYEDAFQGLVREEAAQKGAAKDVATLVSRLRPLRAEQTKKRAAEALAGAWGEFAQGRGPYPGRPGATRFVEAPKGTATEIIGRRAKAAAEAEQKALSEHRAWLREQGAEFLEAPPGRKSAEEVAVEKVPEVEKALRSPPPKPDLPIGAGDAVEAPEGALVRIGGATGRVVEPSADGVTLVVKMPGKEPERIRATSVSEVVWRPEETPEVEATPPSPEETTRAAEDWLLSRRKPKDAAPPPSVPARGAQEPPVPSEGPLAAEPPPIPKNLSARMKDILAFGKEPKAAPYEELPEAKPLPSKKAVKKTGDPAADWWNALPPDQKIDLATGRGLRKSERIAGTFARLNEGEKQTVVGIYDTEYGPLSKRGAEAAGEQGRGATAKEPPMAPAPESPAPATPERERITKGKDKGWFKISDEEYAERMAETRLADEERFDPYVPPEEPPVAPAAAAKPDFRPWVEAQGIEWASLGKDKALADRLRAEYQGAEAPTPPAPEPPAEALPEKKPLTPLVWSPLGPDFERGYGTETQARLVPEGGKFYPEFRAGREADSVEWERLSDEPLTFKAAEKAIRARAREEAGARGEDFEYYAPSKSEVLSGREAELPPPTMTFSEWAQSKGIDPAKANVGEPERDALLKQYRQDRMAALRGEEPTAATPPAKEPAAKALPEKKGELAEAPDLDELIAQQTFKIKGRSYQIIPWKGKYQLLRDTGPKSKMVEPVTGYLAADELRALFPKLRKGEPLPEWPDPNEPGGVNEIVAKYSDEHLEEMIRGSGLTSAEVHETLPMVKAAKAELARRQARTIDVEKVPVEPKPPTPQVEAPKGSEVLGMKREPKVTLPKPKTPPLRGSDTEIRYAGKKQKGSWAAMEADDLQPSHQVEKVSGQWVSSKRPGYPEGVQEREYDPRLPGGKQNWRKVEGIAKELDPAQLVTDIPVATEGAPIVTPDGVVLGGNGRTLGMLLRGTAKKMGLASVKERLLARAAEYGLDPEAIKGMKKPVLVRVVDMDPSKAETRAFAREINVPTTQEEGPVRAAASMNHLIDEGMFKALGGDFDATISHAATGPQGKAFRESLEKAIPETQRGRYFDEKGGLTAAGKDLVEKMMVTKVLDASTVERMTPEQQRAFAGSAVQLARIAIEHGDISPRPQIDEAVRYYNEYLKDSGKDFDEFFGAGMLPIAGDRPPISAGGKMMLEFIAKNAKTPAIFRQKMSKLLETLRQGRKGLLGEVLPAEDFGAALGVKVEPDATFGGGGRGSTTFSANLGGLSQMSKEMKMRALRSVIGGASGYAYASLSDTSDDPEKLAERRLWYTLLGAAVGGAPGWQHLMRGGRKALGVLPENLRRQFRGGVRSHDLWRAMETDEEKSKWLAHEVARALPEFTGNRLAERRIVENMAGEHGFDPQVMKKDLEGLVGPEKAREFVRAVNAYRAHNDRLTDQAVFYKRISPETAEEYRNGWAKRLMLSIIEDRGQPWSFEGTTPRPKIRKHEVRTGDAHGFLLKNLTDKQIEDAFRISGAKDPWATPYGTRLRDGDSVLLKWEPTDAGKYQKDLFAEGLAEALKADGTAPKGGLGRFIDEDFMPLTTAERDAAGEIVNPKAVGYVSLEQRGREVAHGKFYYDLKRASDKHGPLSVDIPKGARGQKLHADGEAWKDPKTGQEYVAVPHDRTWGHLAGHGLRKEWYDELTEFHETKRSMDAMLDAFKSYFKGVKIATPGGAMRNFLGNPIMAWWAEGVPKWNKPKEWRAWARAMEDFGRAALTNDRRIIAKYVEDGQFQLHDRDFDRTGSKDADKLLERYALAGRDAASFLGRKRGEAIGEAMSFGLLSEGRFGLRGEAVAGAGGAAIGALSGLAQGEDTSSVLKRAVYGGVAGAALNWPLRWTLRNYNLIDAAWKAAAMQVHKARGMPLEKSRELVRKRMQDYEHPTKFEKIVSGQTGGGFGAAVSMTANPFIKWYTQLLRTFKNTAADSPAKALTGLMAVPLMEALAVGGAGALGYSVFGSKEERRAAEEKYPGAVFARVPGGPPQGVDLTNIAIMEGLRQDMAGLFNPYGGDAALDLFGSAMGSPALILPEAVQIATNEDPKDTRGFRMVRPGQSKPGALFERISRAFASPLQPNVGTSIRGLEESATEEFQPGRLKRPSEPIRQAARVVTGVPVRKVDFEKDRQALRGRYLSEKAEIEEAFRRAKNQARFRTNPDALKQLVKDTQANLKAARERYLAERDRVLPRESVGAGR